MDERYEVTDKIIPMSLKQDKYKEKFPLRYIAELLGDQKQREKY